MPRNTRITEPVSTGVAISRPNWVSFRPSCLLIWMPMIAKIIHTAKHTVKAKVLSHSARCCCPALTGARAWFMGILRKKGGSAGLGFYLFQAADRVAFLQLQQVGLYFALAHLQLQVVADLRMHRLERLRLPRLAGFHADHVVAPARLHREARPALAPAEHPAGEPRRGLAPLQPAEVPPHPGPRA